MKVSTKKEMLAEHVGGFSLAEWIERWEPLLGGFKQLHPELRGYLGLVRALRDGQTMYILRATETKGGIEKGLQRLRGPSQTGNSKYGASMLREHADQLSFQVIRVGSDESAAAVTKLLKTSMINLWDPEWNRPYRRRIAALRNGVFT